MRLGFQRTPSDLIAALLYTTLVSYAILATGQGALWALLLVIFFPGYVVVAALFPGQGLTPRLRQLLEDAEQLRTAARSRKMDLDSYESVLARAQAAAQQGRLAEAIQILEDGNDRLREDLGNRPGKNHREGSADLSQRDRDETGGRRIDGVERITLSFGLSIAIASLLGLMLNFTPWGIRLESIVVTLFVFTVGVGLVAFGRRTRLPAVDRLSATIELGGSAWGGSSALDKALTATLAASIVFAGAAVAYLVVTPRPTEKFTQLYLLDRNGGVTDYPFRLNKSEPGMVIIVVVNDESAQVHYTLRVNLTGVEFVQNETIVVNRTTLANNDTTLDNRGIWEWPYTFIIDKFGRYRVDFLLFRDDNFAQSYRNTFLFVNVTSG